MMVYLIGTGTEGCRTLTAEASDAISHAELLIGAKRMLEPYADSGKNARLRVSIGVYCGSASGQFCGICSGAVLG